MRIFQFFLLSLFLFISGCTTFNSIRAVEPPVGFVGFNKESKVNSLKPLLSWENPEEYEGSYDLIVMIKENFRFQMPFMKVIYAKNDISSTEHRIEIPLNYETNYYWSVRPSNKKTDDDWARYNFYFIALIVNVWMTNSFFSFTTPEFSPIAINQN